MLFYLGAICDWLGVDCMGAVCDPKIHQRQCSGAPRLLLPAGHPQCSERVTPGARRAKGGARNCHGWELPG